MSAKPDLWMPIYFGPYLTDTMHLTTEQHGAYFLLLMACWKRGGELTDDDAQLAAITRLTSAQWRKARAVIAPFWQIAGGVWRQKRLTVELQAARERSATAKENGSKGGRPKKADDNPTGNPDDTKREPTPKPGENLDESSVPLPRPLQTSRPRPSPQPAPKSVARKRAAPAKTALPNDFSISERVRKWANEKGFHEIEEHLENFVGKCRAKGYTYADWDEALMGAVRDDWAGIRKANGSRQSAIEDAERRIFGGQSERDITSESERL